MPQLFSRRASATFRVLLLGAPLAVAGLAATGYLWARSPATWGVGVPARQPIPFQHSLHVGTLGTDCRYCHSSVERAADAGMPSLQTCLTCHAQVWTGASLLAPLRTAAALGEPLRWTSVHRLPAHSYFHHGAHVTAGVACETCHGRVDQMVETVKAETLSMGWCLDCHRDPTPRLRPREAVFAFGWTPAPATLGPTPGPPVPASSSRASTVPPPVPPPTPPHNAALPDDLRRFYRYASARLTDCATCHR